MRGTITFLFPALCMALAAHAQGVAEWQADVARWQSADWDCGRGETLRLAPSFVSGRSALDLSGIGEGSFHWQTNGMGHLYWSAPARIDTNSRPHRLVADFEPWMDCGAAKYDYFFRAGATNGPVQYRAHGTIRMRGAPGAAPNALPLPVPVLDFARITVTNAPWGEGGGTDGEAVTNIVNGIVADMLTTNTVEESDPVYSADAPALASKAWVVATIGGTNTWMLIAGDLLGVYREADGETNTLWESSSAISGELADVALRATNNTARITALEARPDLTSWGDYAPDGSANPAADEMVYMNRALTMMGSGFSWATSGAYAVLCQSGAVAFLTGTNGEIRIGLDVSTNYFGIVQGGAVTVGCRTDGISVSGSGVDTVVSLTYAYVSGDYPTVWGRVSLTSGEWVELTPVWTTDGNGTAVAAVPGHPYRFFMATSSRNLSARFESNLPARFPAGVYGGLLSEPVRYDSVITVTSGGHTYRLPAELVQ